MLAPVRDPRDPNGFTMIEMLVVLAILGILSVLALVRVQRARTAGNESSAIGSMRAINAAEATYASSCGAAGFAQSLDDLVKPPPNTPQGFISPDLARNGIVKSGFVFNLRGEPGSTIVTPADRTCNGSAGPAMSSYFADTVPVQLGVSGYRSFATDRRNTIYVKEDGTSISPGMYGAVPLQ